jgi:hypothetical protein
MMYICTRGSTNAYDMIQNVAFQEEDVKSLSDLFSHEEILQVCCFNPGSNPTIVSYNASAVKSHNCTTSLVRF